MVSYGHLPEADAEIEAACRRNHATLWPVDFDRLVLKDLTLDERTFDLGPIQDLKMPPAGQLSAQNAAVAVTALSVLAHKGWHITEQNIRDGFAAVQWPGRFEVLGRHPIFLLDGSHNPQGMPPPPTASGSCAPVKRFVFLLSIMAGQGRGRHAGHPGSPGPAVLHRHRQQSPGPCPPSCWPTNSGGAGLPGREAAPPFLGWPPPRGCGLRRPCALGTLSFLRRRAPSLPQHHITGFY